jgi:hypothetical protein
MTGGNIEKGDFIGTLLIVTPRHFHRISGIANIDKLYAFDHAPFVYIQAGNNSFGQPF